MDACYYFYYVCVFDWCVLIGVYIYVALWCVHFFLKEINKIVPPPKKNTHEQTDGIVFQPDAPYQTGTDLSFFKWKWMDTVTIDFAITPTPYKVTCGSGGSGQLDLTKQVRFVAL